jgi:hypothetical protein
MPDVAHDMNTYKMSKRIICDRSACVKRSVAPDRTTVTSG